ncbi:MAG: hypothetical protein V1872_06755 [bacterium]
MGIFLGCKNSNSASQIKIDNWGNIIKDLPNSTVVTHYYFSITIPKGWSIQYGNNTDNKKRLKASLTTTPTNNIYQDKTYIGLHLRRTPPIKTLEETKANLFKNLKGAEKFTFGDIRIES